MKCLQKLCSIVRSKVRTLWRWRLETTSHQRGPTAMDNPIQVSLDLLGVSWVKVTMAESHNSRRWMTWHELLSQEVRVFWCDNKSYIPSLKSLLILSLILRIIFKVVCKNVFVFWTKVVTDMCCYFVSFKYLHITNKFQT